MRGMEGLAQRLIVATPALLDPNFRRAVVLLLEHNDDGALGVVLNSPSDIPVGKVLPQWDEFVSEPKVVFLGGPVRPEAAMALALRGLEDTAAWQPVLGPLGMVDLQAEPAEVAGRVHHLRVLSGYAGWGAGQLEQEIEQGAWFTADVAPEDVLAADTRPLWRQVLIRRGGMYRTVTENPTMN